MNLQKIIGYVFFICIFFFFTKNIFSRDIFHNNRANGSSIVLDCIPAHDINKIVLNVASGSSIGGGSTNSRTCLYNLITPSGSEYPKGSVISYITSTGFWIGGIVNGDTLVSQSGMGEFKNSNNTRYLSNLFGSIYYNNQAISEQDFILGATDTSTNGPFKWPFNWYDYRPHKPLNIKLTRSSYAWSYEYAEDFVLFNMSIKNIGADKIEDMYFSIVFTPSVGYYGNSDPISNDDIAGFLQNYTLKNNCQSIKNLNLVWGADNDGEPINGMYTDKLTFANGKIMKSATGVSGYIFLNQYDGSYNPAKIISYNWYIDSHFSEIGFGPMSRNKQRDFNQSYNGYPFGDASRYFVMSNGEIDYDQIYTASINQFDSVWTYPDQKYADDISKGVPYGGHLLSVGPFDIPPGGVLKIPFAYVAGENFHTKPDNIDFLPDFPQSYYNNLDFSDLAKNAQWARWIYDNPGVDTDGDGDSGLYTICVLDSQFVDNTWKITAADTFWYRGDGVPDWKAAGPPPAPYVWLEPKLNGIRVRFNGSRSETEKDIFTRIPDFEGYNIYIGRDERETSLSLAASYDKENYDKFVYNSSVETYIVGDIPMTLEQIRCAYADSCNDETFDPLLFSRTSPMYYADSLIFFRKHSFNAEQSAVTKVYPNARDPRLIDADSLVDNDYTEDGYFKFFEYEYTIENLLPSVGYWVNVTTFDFGSPKSGLKALETSKTLNIQQAYPLMQADELSAERKQVYIYPNPYRIDAGYRSTGL